MDKMFRRIMSKCILLQLLLISIAIAQDYQDYEPRAAPVRIRQGASQVDTRPTPVPILKQINRHNEDGSYTYGYEGADGSFKIETKLATGEVKGKYGYVDETGKVRVVEYGANKYGFQPSGEGITVAPPTLVDETTNKEGALPEYEDEQPQQKPYIARVSRPQARPAPQLRPISRPEPQYVEYEQEPEPIARPQYSQGPAPPRLQISGAQPQPDDIIYSPQQRPARPNPEYTQTQTFSLPQQQVKVTRPIFSPAIPSVARAGPSIRPIAEQQQQQQQQPLQQQPAYIPRQPAYAAPSPQQQRNIGVLDQLAKDYALPQGGAQPLHDISFGYY